MNIEAFVSGLAGARQELEQRLGTLGALGRRPVSAANDGAGRANERVIIYKRRYSEQKIVFGGGVIAISNLELHDGHLLGALRSRADAVNYDPTDQEVAALMLEIAS